jgi:hypothetical protein
VPARGSFRALLVVGASFLISHSASAEPQWNSGILLGAAGTGDRFRWSDTKFFGALRGEVLFGRSGPLSVGVGPAVELGTAGFSDARFGAGATVLVPLDGVLALGFTPATYLRTSHASADSGVSGRLSFLVHPSNIVGCYAMAGGLVVGADRDFGPSRSTALIVGAQIDGMVLALPVILLVEWLRGPPD